jgi:hypothetical protein
MTDSLPPQTTHSLHAIDLVVLPTPREEASEDKSVREKFMRLWFKLGPRTRVICVEAFLLSLAMVIVLPWYFSDIATNSWHGMGELIEQYPSPPITDGIGMSVLVSSIDPLTLKANTQIFIDGLGSFDYGTYTQDEADHGLLFFNVISYQPILTELLKQNNLTTVPGTAIDQQANLTLYISSVGKLFLKDGSLIDYAQIGLDQSYKLKALKPVTFYPLDQYQLRIYTRLLLSVNGEFLDSDKNPVNHIEYSFPNLQVNAYEESTDFRGKGNITVRLPLAEYGDLSYQTIAIDITFTRSTAVIGISFFVICLAWLLTIATLTMAIDEYAVRPLMMDINPTRVVIATGLLYALPSLRSVQPGIPPLTVYSGSDILGFYLPMALIALSGVMMINKAVWTYQPKKGKKN